MPERNCSYCGATFEAAHGNRLYCDLECYMEQKKARNRVKYAAMKHYKPLFRNDQILRALFESGHEIVKREVITRLGFDERIHLKKLSGNGNPIHVMGQFGAQLHSTQEIKIHHLDHGNH